MASRIAPAPQLKPVVVDLFCGAGGMSLGFQMAGYDIRLGIEKEMLPYQTHCHNFGGCCHHGDIQDIKDPAGFVEEHGLKRVDVVIGGPPCQGFSRVGRGKLRDLLEKDGKDASIGDPRNQYYKDFVRFVKALQPIFFVMENVPDMRYYMDGDELLIDKALAQFRGMDYYVETDVLQADHYGVPQTRRRFFIIGSRIGKEITWPKKTHEGSPVTLWQAIGDLPIVQPGFREDEMHYVARQGLTKYQKLMREGAGDRLYNHQTRWHNEQDIKAFALLPEGGRYVDLPKACKRYRDDIFRDKYRKLYRDKPSWTVEAHIGKDSYRHIYPSREGEAEPPRTISVREAARLQSFPDRFRFCGPFTKQFHQVGNAVPPLLATAIAEAILPSVQRGMSTMITTENVCTPPVSNSDERR